MNTLQRRMQLAGATAPVGLPIPVPEPPAVAVFLPHWCGNINPLLLRGGPLRTRLARDSPTANDVLPWNPCPFGGSDFHAAQLLLPPGSALGNGSPGLAARLCPDPHAPLPDQPLCRGCCGVSVLGFSPVHFRGQTSRRINCYVLVRGLLFLSIPFRCFRDLTRFVFTLSQDLGTLTPLGVVPLSPLTLTASKPSGTLRWSQIRSL